MINRATTLICIVLIGVGILFRFYNLGRGSYWLDELSTVEFAKKPLNELITGKYYEPGKSPLHYVVLALWIKTFGASEVSSRVLFVLINCLSILFVYLLLKKFIHNNKVVLLFTALYAICWLHVWGAREARYYSVLLLMCVLSNYFYLYLIRENKRQLFYMLISTLGLYTHVLFFWLLIPQAVVYILKHKKIDRNIFCFIFPLVLFIPYLWQMYIYLKIQNVTSIFNTTGQINEQFRGTPMNIYSIASTLFYIAPPAVIYGIIVIFSLLIYFYFKRSLFEYKEIVLLFVVQILFTVMPPFNRFISNNYYLYYLTPTFFLFFALLLKISNKLAEKIFLYAIVLIFLYFNLIYLKDYQNNLNISRYNDLAKKVSLFKKNQLMFFVNCADNYMVKYYLNYSDNNNTSCDIDILKDNLNINHIYFAYPSWEEDKIKETTLISYGYQMGEISSYGPTVIKEFFRTH